MRNFWVTTTFFALLVARSSSVEPEIVEEPKDVTVLQGEDATLRCVVEHLPSTDLTPVQWTRGDFALGYDRNLSDWDRYSMVGDVSVGEYHLHIKDANVVDDNLYECQVTEHLLRTRKATLTVMVPPTGPFVEGKEKDKVTMIDVIYEKENFITCRAINGKPAAKLQWYKNGVEIVDNITSEVIGPQRKLYNTSSTLRIIPTSDDAEITYACVMTSDAVPVDQFARKLIKLNILRPPVVSVALPPSIEEGVYVTAVCRATADTPVSLYRWYIDGKEQTGETSSTFDLGVANKTWQGSVVGCEAKNAGGFSEINATAVDVLYPPLFVGGSDIVTAEIGENVTLWCGWDSNPKPTIHWILEDDLSFTWTSATLEISNVEQSDSGRYICVANAGEIGTSRVSSDLIVNGPPLFASDETQSGVLNEDSVIECGLASHPGIERVEWTWKSAGVDFKLFGNQSITASGEEVAGSGTSKYQGYFVSGKPSVQLRIRNTGKEDLHPFFCFVSNSYGEMSMEISLKEDTSNANDLTVIGIAVGAALGGVLLLLILILLACYCVRSKRQRKSTTFSKSLSHLQKTSSNSFGKDKEEICTTDESIPINQVIHSLDGSDGFNNPEPLSSPGEGPASTVSGSDETNPTPMSGQDDGYHTEEPSSWIRSDHGGKSASGVSSPAKNAFPHAGCFVNLPPPLETIEHKKPLLDSHHPNAYPYAKYPQRSMSVDPYSYNELPYNPAALAQPISTIRSTSALGERLMEPPARYTCEGSSEFGPYSTSSYAPAPLDYYAQSSRSLIPMHSVTEPSPRVDRPRYGRSASIPATAFLGIDRGMQIPAESSQSSLDNFERGSALSASALAGRAIDQENLAGRRSNLSSRMSQASRSSEFVRPFVARMATHV